MRALARKRSKTLGQLHFDGLFAVADRGITTVIVGMKANCASVCYISCEGWVGSKNIMHDEADRSEKLHT